MVLVICNVSRVSSDISIYLFACLWSSFSALQDNCSETRLTQFSSKRHLRHVHNTQKDRQRQGDSFRQDRQTDTSDFNTPVTYTHYHKHPSRNQLTHMIQFNRIFSSLGISHCLRVFLEVGQFQDTHQILCLASKHLQSGTRTENPSQTPDINHLSPTEHPPYAHWTSS